MQTLQKKFNEEIIGQLQKELGIKNSMAVGRINKIVLNMGLVASLKDPKILEEATVQLAKITGQKPVVTRAKQAIAGFKLRKGDAIGAMVTLRGVRMYDFLEKLIKIVLPRVRDFQGVSNSAFDRNGNYSIGFSEISVFPEVDGSTVGRGIGLEITVQTSAKTDELAKKLLELLGMPFKKVKS